MVFGLLYQVVGLGLCAPLYLLAHVVTSPTASTPTSQIVTVSNAVLLSIIPSISIGMILPTILMSLPTPTYLQYATKANLVLLWQFFPLWTSILCVGLSQWLSTRQFTLNASTLRKTVYSSAITLSSVAHIAALTISVTAAIVPSMYNPVYVRELKGAYLDFPPWPIQSATQASSIAEGALWFIQYDYILTSWAFLFWSISLRSAVHSKEGEASTPASASQLLLTLGRAVVLGPLGAAAYLVWDRDEALLSAEKSGDRAKVK